MDRVSTYRIEDGPDCVEAQVRRLAAVSLNQKLAHKLIEMVGPAWSVPTFLCYLENRRRFGGKAGFEAMLNIMHLDGLSGCEEFNQRLLMLKIDPPDASLATREMLIDDPPRILAALRYFAQRY
jgi:hypothetical protein